MEVFESSTHETFTSKQDGIRELIHSSTNTARTMRKTYETMFFKHQAIGCVGLRFLREAM